MMDNEKVLEKHIIEENGISTHLERMVYIIRIWNCRRERTMR